MSNVTSHVPPAEIVAYQRRTLAPRDLLRVDDHLALCETCRRKVDGADRLEQAIARLSADFTDAVEPLEHPAIEQLGGYVDGTLDQVERELIDAHLDVCPSCAEDTKDLREVRASVAGASATVRSGRGRWTTYGVVTAVAASLAGLLVWTGVQSPSNAPPEPTRAEVSTPVPASAPASSAPRLTLNDGGAIVTRAADGRIDGLPRLPGEEMETIERALREGRITVPGFLNDLAGAPGRLMGGASSAPEFGPLRPVATAVESDRPRFEWAPLPGATSYVVGIFDTNLRKVTESPRLTVRDWQPAVPLTRARAYIWQVRAIRGDDEIVAPAPPLPEARFHVLSAAEAGRLANLRFEYGGFHLVLGVLLSEAGVLDEAERELEQLAAANAGMREATRLLDSLRERRKALASRR